MKKNIVRSVVWTGIAVVALSLAASSAEAENPAHAAPLFQCGVYFGAGDKPMVKVTHSGGGAVDASHDVVAVIQTPSGRVDASLCGRSFPSVGSSASVSWSGTQKQGYLYTCTASQGATTFACNPVR
jgi:hypothetical protein